MCINHTYAYWVLCLLCWFFRISIFWISFFEIIVCLQMFGFFRMVARCAQVDGMLMRRALHKPCALTLCAHSVQLTVATPCTVAWGALYQSFLDLVRWWVQACTHGTPAPSGRPRVTQALTQTATISKIFEILSLMFFSPLFFFSKLVFRSLEICTLSELINILKTL